jgi:N-methylhydantoinase A
MSELRDEARKELDPTGLAESQVDVGLYAQMCYPGQNFDMSVPVPEGDALDEPGLLDLSERFHEQHQADRGFNFRNQQPLLRGVRLVARGSTPKPERLAPLGTVRDAKAARRGARRVYFGPEFVGSGFVEAPVYDGSVLGPGVDVRGPALIEEPFTVVVLPPGATARLDELGNYELTVS